jgi:hypothetical protein
MATGLRYYTAPYGRAKRKVEVSTMRSTSKPLVYTSVALAIGMALHGLDHAFGQERGVGGLDSEVRLGGAILAVVAAIAIYLAFTGNRRAPISAVAAGFGIAILVTNAHILPEWSSLSDSYPELGLGAHSWAAMLSEVVAALAFGIAGLYELRGTQVGRPVPAAEG